MKMKIYFFKSFISLSMLSGIFFLLSGCMAIPLVLMAANAGIVAHSVTKTVQMSTDGDVEMAIGENEVASQKKLVLSDITKLAIWPDEGMVFVANELQKSKIFTKIATPSETQKMLFQSGSSGMIKNLTYQEKISAFKNVCEKTDTEAVIVFESLGQTTNMRMWSFSRSSMDFKGKIVIFELQSNGIIYSSITEMKINLGGSSPNQREIMKNAAKMLANRIIELKQGKAIAQK
jgi:hypothetical protein